MEFTGDYNRCTNCNHIYDYDDLCPECSADFAENLNANEVRELIKEYSKEEQKRLEKMLQSHDD